ncbi:MAG: hypothetical protein JWN84_1938 [Nocardioides sp.]|nr:hypothetical protein [Nocardioides sp.]
MRLFHIATVTDWDAARASGRYTTSTRGRTLAEEGFIHASRGDQWQGVRERFYADVTEPLVLLVIDTDRLGSPVVEEGVPDSDETFPHVYGPIEADAVVRTIPLVDRVDRVAPAPDGAPAEAVPSEALFSRIYFEEMFRNLAMASLVLLVVVLGALGGRELDDQWGAITGAALGLAVGVLVVRRLFRRSGR